MTDRASPAPAPRRHWRTTLLLIVLAFVAGLAVMTWGLTRWQALRQVAGITAPVEPARSPVRLSDGATALPPPTSAADAARVDARVSDLEGRIARVDLRAAAAASNAGRAEGLLIAFAARRALDRGTGLGYLEAQLRDRFGDTQPRAVGAIIAASQAPVTLAMLRQELDAIAPKLTRGTARGWWDATRDALASLVIVRHEGQASPAPDERLMRARMMLDGGQVDGAFAEIARLPGRAAAAQWMGNARRYVEARHALDIIEAAAILPTPPAAVSPTPQGSKQ